ncbi:hypothetical protein N0V93_004765 [Gnomoniopsis smithogilvyi]|uniref:Peptidase M43 pregnancy-associated plasma-A domain-containing protein n=1 Tax=Gnomoniopsis smithogilvyi TaxID=1191159 RepID=A0A9W8YS21_9PEZI|nr:hypothetical protein N0V93_004765 [Gnomoniopsis smithogilvyi]
MPLALTTRILALGSALALASPASRASERSAPCLNDVAGTISSDSFEPIQRRGGHIRRAVNETSITELDVYFHIASSQADADLITDDIVAAQFSVLQESFAEQDIHLTLVSTDRVVDDLTAARFFAQDPDTGVWTDYNEQYLAYVKSTRKGGYDALNLYFYTTYLPGATGYCTWPLETTVTEGSDVFYRDSCQLSARTMPGLPVERQFDGWNMGHMAVHETGHWLGLNHTFTGGCSGDGDFVSDTPAHALIYDCPTGSDTCPTVPGLDPIHNFMGYTNDTCTSEFTPGQKDRMLNTFYNFRRRS